MQRDSARLVGFGFIENVFNLKLFLKGVARIGLVVMCTIMPLLCVTIIMNIILSLSLSTHPRLSCFNLLTDINNIFNNIQYKFITNFWCQFLTWCLWVSFQCCFFLFIWNKSQTTSTNLLCNYCKYILTHYVLFSLSFVLFCFLLFLMFIVICKVYFWWFEAIE